MNFYFPCNILFGKVHIDDFVASFSDHKIAIITNKGKKRLANEIIVDILTRFNKMGTEYIVVDCAQPNPTYENVMCAISAIKENNCNAVIAIGGGSCIDCAKAAAYCAVNDGDMWYYVNNPNKCTNNSLPLGVINTTAGTGSEINCCAVITKANEKKALFCTAIYPKSVLIIPELLSSIPLKNSIDQTLDSMYHAIEGYFSVNASTFSEICSENCIKLCVENIDNLIKYPTDVNVREKLCIASIYSGMADMYGGCLSAHSIGHAITAYHPEISHGMSITMIASKYYSKMLNTVDMKISAKKTKLTNLFTNAIPSINADTDDFGEVLSNFFDHIGLKDYSLTNNGIGRDEAETLYNNARQTVGILFENDPVALSNEDFVDIINKSM